jgi:hypothetical protein
MRSLLVSEAAAFKAAEKQHKHVVRNIPNNLK